jgi:predicted transcriptional regulator
MSRQQYRSELGIVKEILASIINHGKPGIIVSAISRIVNLSHYATVEKCRKLTDAGLIDLAHQEGRRVIVVTEKGIEFSQKIESFTEYIQQANLRY